VTEHTLNEYFAAALASCVAFLGALGAAMKLWPKAAAKPVNGVSMDDLMRINRELAEHGGEFKRAKEDREAMRVTVEKIFDEIRATRAEVAEANSDISVIKAMLNARKGPR